MANYKVLGRLEQQVVERYLSETETSGASKKLRSKIIATALGIAVGAAITTMVSSAGPIAIPVMAATKAAATYQGSVNVGPFIAYVKYITHIIQIVSASLFGLGLTYLGAKQVTTIEGNAMADMKRYITGAIWACLFIFGGTTIANIFVSHIPTA